MKLVLSLSFLLLTFGACIEPFNIHLQKSQPALVVDGLITDQPGPYTVQIFTTSSIDNQSDHISWVRGAAVSIYDDQGAEETLQEVTPGHYQTTAFQGVVGRTYHIRITTSDGNSYESVPEKLLPVGDLTSVEHGFVQNETPPSNNPLSSVNGFNIYLDAAILHEQNGLVRWRWTGTYQVLTYPEYRTKVKPNQGPILDKPILIPDPPTCSGYVIDSAKAIQTTKVGNCTCCNCWVEQYNQTPLLSDKRFIDNNFVKGFNVAFIPVTRRTFFDKYYLEIEQMSVSQIVYDFWKKVEEENQNGSNLFQTPPPRTLGNIQNVTPGTIPALGVFAAAAVKKQSVVMTRNMVPYTLLPIDTLANSCLVAYQFSSNVKPSFW